MRWFVFIPSFICMLFGSCIVFAQEVPSAGEQQLENLTDLEQTETEDDNWLQELEQFRKNPINLNTADEEELKQLRLLTGLQIAGLISYRNLFGKLISIYELQAVPAWDIETIKKILPFVTISSSFSFANAFSERLRNGEHHVLLRVTQVLEKAKGFDRSIPGTKFLGSPQRIFFRHRYTYRNLLQWGVAGEKDAGEQFFKGAQRHGFDFYTVHFFARKLGVIQSLALGDFIVNMGQGLMHWQGLAFKKSVDVLGIKRQSAVLRPYNSAGEFYFHRGAGITLRKGNFESTLFISSRKLSANFVADTVNNENFISSFLTSGYHRTSKEVEDRNILTQTTLGGNLVYRKSRWHAGINGVYYRFSLPIRKRQEPYNRYAINGNNWFNMSADYSYTYKNLHFFGEAAMDKRCNMAFTNGLLISVDTRVDISLLYRNISKAYQAVYGNAFTENAYPTNENGFYAGISIRPAMGWRVDAYADFFKFPWLKYLVDAPSRGTDFFSQLTYTPDRQIEIYTRYRIESKQANQKGNTTVSNYLVNLPRQNWRTQLSYKVSSSVTLRTRTEILWYDRNGPNKENGYLIFSDIHYKPMRKPVSAVIRLQYFETDGYNSRIYAYENDVQYSFSIPAFFFKGFRYYMNLNLDFWKKISMWVRLAQSIFQNRSKIGSGLEEIPGNRKTELKLQIRWLL